MEGDVAITIWRNEADLGVKVVEEENKYVEEIICMENRDHWGKWRCYLSTKMFNKYSFL